MDNQPPTDPACIFCKIISGEIPSHKLYEDEHVYSFLDIGPVARGHALIIPKGHWVTADALPEEVAGAVGRSLQKVSKALVEATGCESWNILQNNGESAGQVVMHVHFHIIPRYSGTARGDGEGLPFDWPAKDVDHGEAAKLAEQVRGMI